MCRVCVRLGGLWCYQHGQRHVTSRHPCHATPRHTHLKILEHEGNTESVLVVTGCGDVVADARVWVVGVRRPATGGGSIHDGSKSFGVEAELVGGLGLQRGELGGLR